MRSYLRVCCTSECEGVTFPSRRRATDGDAAEPTPTTRRMTTTTTVTAAIVHRHRAIQLHHTVWIASRSPAPFFRCVDAAVIAKRVEGEATRRTFIGRTRF